MEERQGRPTESVRASPRHWLGRCETDHNVRLEFMASWQASGRLARFGFSLSEEFTERLENGKPDTVRYLEWAWFELHPENQPSYNAKLGQFGRRICGNGCW